MSAKRLKPLRNDTGHPKTVSPERYPRNTGALHEFHHHKQEMPTPAHNGGGLHSAIRETTSTITRTSISAGLLLQVSRSVEFALRRRRSRLPQTPMSLEPFKKACRFGCLKCGVGG